MMPNLSEDEKHRLFMTLDAQTKQLNKLETGMFGDEKLRQKGLIDDMIEVKNWIQQAKLKVTFIAGIGAACGFFFTKIWEYIISILHK